MGRDNAHELISNQDLKTLISEVSRVESWSFDAYLKSFWNVWDCQLTGESLVRPNNDLYDDLYHDFIRQLHIIKGSKQLKFKKQNAAAYTNSWITGSQGWTQTQWHCHSELLNIKHTPRQLQHSVKRGKKHWTLDTP